MPTPQIKIHNAETGEIIVRDMNAKELAIYEKESAEFDALQATIAERAVAKALLLERLGITEDEAKILLG